MSASGKDSQNVYFNYGLWNANLDVYIYDDNVYSLWNENLDDVYIYNI